MVRHVAGPYSFKLDFIRQMIDLKNGLLEYDFKGAKFSVVRTIEEYGWVLGGGTYYSEIKGPLIALRNFNLIIGDIAQNSVKLDASSAEILDISKEMARGTEVMAASSETVAASAKEMSTNMTSVAAAIEESSTNISMVSAAAEEMTSTITEIAQNTEKTKSASQQMPPRK